MVVSYDGNGTVYSFKPDALDGEITLLKPQKASQRAGMTPILPVNYWRNENDFCKDDSDSKAISICLPRWNNLHSCWERIS